MNGKIRRLIVAAALMAVLAISGISAYFTDGDTATNIFTVGNVQIDLQETMWLRENLKGNINITPGQTFYKNPKVENIGTNAAYVFMEVVVPYVDVVIADEEGNKDIKKYNELFSYKITRGFWEELTDKKKIDKENKTVTHLYAFVNTRNNKMRVVRPGNYTDYLFRKITFANIVEDQAQTAAGGENLEKQRLSVKVNAYAIQTDNINDGRTAPAEVWAVLSKQAPTTAMPDGVTEDSRTDVIS